MRTSSRIIATAAALGLIALSTAGVQGAAAATPAIPAWIKVGGEIEHLGCFSHIVNGQVTNPVTATETTKVTAIASGKVYATTLYQVLQSPVKDTFSWDCSAAGKCAGAALQFWVDPKAPTQSIHGPNGETYKVLGSEKYTDPWRRVFAATMLAYKNAASGVAYSITYRTADGLILAIDQNTPTSSLEIYFYL